MRGDATSFDLYHTVARTLMFFLKVTLIGRSHACQPTSHKTPQDFDPQEAEMKTDGLTFFAESRHETRGVDT